MIIMIAGETCAIKINVHTAHASASVQNRQFFEQKATLPVGNIMKYNHIRIEDMFIGKEGAK